MHIQDLIWFRENVAAPKLQKLLQNTVIPEGYCCISHLDISLLDCRSCGLDSELTAKGLVYKDGKVQAYSFNEYDFATSDFYEKHKDSVFLSDGVLHIQDELQEMEVTTVLRNIGICAKLFPDLKKAVTLQMDTSPLEYLKMQQLMNAEKGADLDHKIQSATASQNERAFDHPISPSKTVQER